MSWRIIYITNVDKLSLNLNSIQIIHENNTYFVSLNEIAMLVVEDYKSIITVRLLIELAKQGIPMIILGMNNMPIGEYFPIADYYVYNILMKILKSEVFELTKEIKIELINIVNNKVSYKNKVYSMINVVSVFISDIISFINLDGKEALEIPRLINE